MVEPSPPFDEAVESFRAFLQAQRWPTELRWLTRDHLVGRGRKHWVYRPEALASDEESRGFYEEARRAGSSIGLVARWRLDGRALAYVEDHGGARGGLHLAVAEDIGGGPVDRVSSPVLWACLRALTAFLGESPFLASTRLTGTRTSDRPAAP
jgi:hypothetical protein